MVIGWLNEKGGIGKTSLCFNTGWYLADLGKKILFIDLDGQRANLSYFCGIKDRDDKSCMKDVLLDNINVKESIIKIKDNIDIIPGNVDLTEINKSVKVGKMKSVIDELKNEYDYIFIDVNPTPSRIHILTMGISDYIIIPMLPDVASLESNLGIIETYSLIKENNINEKLKILGIVFNRYNARANLSQQVLEITKQMAKKLNTQIFNTKIRNNIAMSENVSKHIGVTEYDPKCNAASDIIALTAEILARGV